MKPHNRGYEVEASMKKWFKGEDNHYGCVDFSTKTSLYEVKSCNLFNGCVNGNQKRDYVVKKHLQITTTQLGRFFVQNYNHLALKSMAATESKKLKYIFVVCVGKQKIWCVKSWEFVDKFIHSEDGATAIRIKDVFGDDG